MAQGWNDWALFGLVPLLVGLPMALLVFLARPGNWENRWFALLIVAESVFVGLYWGVMSFVADPRLAHALGMTGFSLVFHAPILYLLFLATLPAPLSRPLARPTGRGVLLAGLAATTVLPKCRLRPRMAPGFCRGLTPSPRTSSGSSTACMRTSAGQTRAHISTRSSTGSITATTWDKLSGRRFVSLRPIRRFREAF